MNVPNIQGALRYAYKMTIGGADKEAAEGWAFARAVLPFIDECDSDAAELISRNQDYFAASPMADGAKEVFKAYQSVFTCMGIDCDDIGELEGAPACNTFALEFANSGNPVFVGYNTASDVTEHGEIGLDMQEIIASVTAGAEADITNAKTIYMDGKNSAKTSSLR